MELGIKTSTSSSVVDQQADTKPLPENCPPQVDFYSYSEDDENGMVQEQHSSKKICSKALICCLIILLLLGIIAAVGIFLLDWGPLLGLKEESEAILENDEHTTAPNVDTSPTLEPNESSFTFEPPSPGDCVAITKGDAVEGQDQMLLEPYEVDLDISLDFGGTEFDALLNRLAFEIRQTILPEMAGCADANRQLMEVSIPSLIRSNRQLNTRYAIGNAAVDIFNPLGEWCSAGSGPLCYRVVVTLNVALKGDVNVMTVLNLITEAFDDDSLVSKLDLGSPFQSIVLKNVLPAFATPTPTFQPT